MRTVRFHLSLLFSFLFISSNAIAGEKPLTTKLLDQYIAAFESIKTLGLEEPSDTEQRSTFWYLEDNGKKAAEYMSSLPASGKIKKIAKSNGFSSLEEMSSVLSRFTSAAIAVQMENEPSMKVDKKQLEEAKKAREDMRAQMLASGMPEAMVDNQIKQMEKFSTLFVEMEEIAKQASAEDIKFARQHLDYMEKMMPDDEDMDEDNPMYQGEEMEEDFMGN